MPPLPLRKDTNPALPVALPALTVRVPLRPLVLVLRVEPMLKGRLLDEPSVMMPPLPLPTPLALIADVTDNVEVVLVDVVGLLK